MKQKILLITILFLVFITSVYGVNEILGSQYQSPILVIVMTVSMIALL